MEQSAGCRFDFRVSFIGPSIASVPNTDYQCGSQIKLTLQGTEEYL